jgi:hypothetical protein
MGNVGEIKVESPWASPVGVAGPRFGQFENHGKLLVVKLKLTNTSKTKVMRFAGWQGNATVVDQHGNAYKPYSFGSGFAFADTPNRPGHPEDAEYDKGSDADSIIAGDMPLHPGKSYITFLFFEEPAAVSEEARLTLPAKALGGTGGLRLRVPIK